jgi:hypothetical protein
MKQSKSISTVGVNFQVKDLFIRWGLNLFKLNKNYLRIFKLIIYKSNGI